MSFDPNVSNRKLTYERPTWETIKRLMGTGAHNYCQIMSPIQCKRGEKDVVKECAEIYEQCIIDYRRVEEFSWKN